MSERIRVTVDWSRLRFGVLLILAVMGFTGCSGWNTSTLPASSLEDWSSRVVLLPLNTDSDARPVPLAASSSVEAPPPASPIIDTNEDDFEDDFFDPFARTGEEGIEEYDPWEPLNLKFFEFNRQFDRWLLKPVATGYNVVVPNPVQKGISNFFYNLRFPPRFLNNLFQGKVKGAGIEVGRFLVNSTVGIGGFLDVAQHFDLITPEEDTGQTLGFYGMKPGPYVVIPLLPPLTVRDLVGYIGDIFLNPINWLVAPLIEVEGVPSLIPHRNRTTTGFVQTGGRVFEIVNERALNLEKFQGVEEATLDLYTAVRNAYLQRRAQAIRE